jgi:hypothetical protein
MTDARVVGLHRTTVAKAPPERIDEAGVIADFGIEGDRHARAGSSRQVVLTQREVLDALGLAAGATREQLTVSGLGVLAAGDVLSLGSSVQLELVRPRVPCRVMDKVRPGLRAQLEGRGGWCARVLSGGTLRCGDVVSVGALADAPWLVDYRRASAEWEASAFTTGPSGDDGWSTPHARLAHLIAWEERAVARIAELAAGGASVPAPSPTDIDAFNATAVDRLLGAHPNGDLWDLHDDSSTAVLDAARRWPEHAEAWVRSLAGHYREHT